MTNISYCFDFSQMFKTEKKTLLGLGLIFFFQLSEKFIDLYSEKLVKMS